MPIDRPASHRLLLEMTGLPTAAGREERVIAAIGQWVDERPSLRLTTDAHGNLMICRAEVQSGSAAGHAAPPLIFQAHLDHPAFVVHHVTSDNTLLAVFRGGVKREYFLDSPVQLHRGDLPPVRGRVTAFETPDSPGMPAIQSCDQDAPLVRIMLDTPAAASPGDLLTWEVGPPSIREGILHAPACDDLSAVAAAMAGYDQWLADTAGSTAPLPDVRLLLTRAEEIGFIGTIGACKAGSLPRDARFICLENSKSFADSPQGDGPIVRVGDFTSVFDPELTYRVGRVAQEWAKEDPTFKHQRKLMAGGTCEASAFGAYGYIATCLCLPLGNYHNMNEQTGRIDAETIALTDYDGLVTLLGKLITDLDDPAIAPPLRDRLESLFAQRAGVLA